jgi:hypothetical protein
VNRDKCMGHWGVKSFENDLSDEALDAGFERVHGAVYEELMDDGNPLSFDQVQKRLADERTLAAAVEELEAEAGASLRDDHDSWDVELRLALAGVVVRHAELGVAIPERLRDLAVNWLECEEIEWEEETKRRPRREKEIALLRRARTAPSDPIRTVEPSSPLQEECS